MTYITIDGGTTNTRVSLVKDGAIVRTEALSMGAKSNMEHKAAFEAALKRAIAALRHPAERDAPVKRILASGMITSEFGLCSLPHIRVPAGIRELHASMREVTIPSICEIPFVFVPGVKTEGETIADADMMRGEETELIGLMEHLERAAVYVLPGSHSKLIHVDAAGRIVDFTTMLTGEMIAALSQNTILKDAVHLAGTRLDEKALKDGYAFAKEHGVNAALFKVRVLKNQFQADADAVYSFFLGAVLEGEVREIAKAEEEKVVIGGKEAIKCATAKLLAFCTEKEIVAADAAAVLASTARGLVKIYEYQK